MVCYNPILMYPVEGAITKNGKQHYSFYGSLASHPELAGDSRFIRCSCKQCIGCRLKIADSGLSVLSTKPVLRLLLISSLALSTIIICHVIKA